MMLNKSNLGSTYILILVVFAILFLFQLLSSTPRSDFSKGVSNCNKVESGERFSCYRAALEKFGGSSQEDLKENIEWLNSDNKLSFSSEDNSYAIFGTSCHTFYHAVGDIIASKTKSIGEISDSYRQCSNKCTSGCMMGFFKRTALNNFYKTEMLKELYGLCKDEEKSSCAHEIGHLLHDKYTTSILGLVDKISMEKYGLVYGQNPQYQTFNEPDLEAPFGECNEIILDERYRRQCYTGIGHNMFVFSEFDPRGLESVIGECQEERLLSESREKCEQFLVFRVGINNVASKFLSMDYSGGTAICSDLAETINSKVEEHCYIGLGGGLGLFIESELDSFDPKKISKEIDTYSRLCEKAPEAYKDSCYKGLLGTDFKRLYRHFELRNETIDSLIDEIEFYDVTG